MKRYICSIFMVATALSAVASTPAPAEKKDSTFGYNFTTIKEVAATSPKDQSRSGTCWSFSGLGFLESEVLKNGKGEVFLSPMWVARHAYFEKAIKFVRMHGKLNFGAGGSFADVINIVKKYGIVPESAYRGLNYGTDNHNHSELDALLESYVKTVVKNPNKTLSTAWVAGLNGILDAYFGVCPTSFEYDGEKYTPESFTKYLGLDMNNYVSITSYTHHPFYSQFVIEIPDNWAYALSYNVPLDEFTEIFENAIMNDYTIAWGSDVSEKGFKYGEGYAIVAEEVKAPENLEGTELSRWVKLNKEKTEAASGPAAEKKITQELRQQAYDNYQTTDDHGMQIMGIAEDQNGNMYYKVKNSWATNQLYGGYFYASVPFVAYKTMNIVVNKNAIPKNIREKLNIQ